MKIRFWKVTDLLVKPMTILFVGLLALGGAYGTFARASGTQTLALSLSAARADTTINIPQAVKTDQNAQVTGQPGEIVTSATVKPVTVDDWLSFVFQSMGGLGGAGMLAAALFAVKAIIMFMNTPLFEGISGWAFHRHLSPRAKMNWVLGLNVVLAFLAIYSQGNVTWGAALAHSTTVAAASVFLNQIFKRYLSNDPEQV